MIISHTSLRVRLPCGLVTRERRESYKSVVTAEQNGWNRIFRS